MLWQNYATIDDPLLPVKIDFELARLGLFVRNFQSNQWQD
jgi:hypothetical protein